jgi:hypothetical protein
VVHGPAVADAGDGFRVQRVRSRCDVKPHASRWHGVVPRGRMRPHSRR